MGYATGWIRTTGLPINSRTRLPLRHSGYEKNGSQGSVRGNKQGDNPLRFGPSGEKKFSYYLYNLALQI